jgi:NADPH2:quinone reductase
MTAQPAGELAIEPLPETMLAWQVVEAGDPPDSLSLNEIEVPHPGAGEVLIEVWSAGVGLADVEGMRRADLGLHTPGVELCGEIVAVGEGVTRSRLGERVVGATLEPHGSLAKFALARATDVFPAPTRLDDATASVFHIPYQVGWMGLYRRATVRVGEALVVHAAAGGLGSAAVQLGRAAGAKVIAVVGSAEKIEVCKRLGADVVIDRSSTDVVEAVRKATDGAGADVIYDPVGGAAFTQSTRMVAFEGRIIIVGFAGGRMNKLPTEQVLDGNFSIYGLNWRSYLDAKPEIVVRAHADLSSLAEVGALRPLLTAKLDFEDAPEALTRLATGGGIGRIAVSPP